jgi:hypothetical protein
MIFALLLYIDLLLRKFTHTIFSTTYDLEYAYSPERCALAAARNMHIPRWTESNQ